MMSGKRLNNLFNIRVYGLLLDQAGNVLVADEQVFGKNITKFPGGGLQFGEGTIECLIREFREELNQEIEVISHFYTTDFFQPSAFHENQQIISIYYLVGITDHSSIIVSGKPFNYPGNGNELIAFRWLSLSMAKPQDVTLPIDRKVLAMLKDHFLSL